MSRLMSLFTGGTLLGIVVWAARDLLVGDGGWLVWRTAVAGVLTVALVALLVRKPLSLPQLRVLEAVVFGTLALGLAVQAFAPGGTTSGASFAARDLPLRFALLIVAYGIFVPNNPLRAAAGVAMIAATPLVIGFLLGAPYPGGMLNAPAFMTGDGALETALLLAAAGGIAVFAAFLTGNLFDFAFEQRRRTFYDLEEQIGSGGMGEVWRARHRALARPTALKLIRRDKVVGDDGDESVQRVLQRFEREAKATAALRSPHTIDVYDFGVTEDGHFFYAMEYLEGLDLETLVRQHGPVPAERAVHILLQACDSLADAHAHGLIHRDIKPANLYLTQLGPSADYVKLLDFGLVLTAPVGPTSEHITADGITSGTPAYMAPEMATHEERVDSRADLYALGAVAYWLLTGKYVFEATSGVAMIVEHVRTQPTPPSRRTELPVPPALDDIVMKCLEKDPNKRFQSAIELAAALAEVPLPQPWTARRAADWWDLHHPQTSAA